MAENKIKINFPSSMNNVYICMNLREPSRKTKYL